MRVAHLAPPPDWPKMRTRVGVATKFGDVLADPLEGEDKIELAGVAAVGEVASADIGEVEVAEEIEAMVESDDYDVSALDEVDAVVDRAVAAAGGVGSAVDVDEDGTLSTIAEGWGPNVEVQAVFAVEGIFFVEG